MGNEVVKKKKVPNPDTKKKPTSNPQPVTSLTHFLRLMYVVPVPKHHATKTY